MRIVADTNLLIASIFWNGVPFRIVEKALDGVIEIFTGQAILDEISKVLQQEFHLDSQEIDDILHSILSYTKMIVPLPVIEAKLRDPKDSPIIACALASRADFIVTRDKDLLVLKEYQGIPVVSPEDFMSYL